MATVGSTKDTFPVINISAVTKYLTGDVPDEAFFNDENIKELSAKFVSAFIEWGFVYLVGHDIKRDVIDKAFEISKYFFLLDVDTKKKFARPNSGENWGWVPFNVETFEKTRPYDLKECFNFLPTSLKEERMNEQLPSFIPTLTAFFNLSVNLANYLLKLLTMALPTEDTNFLVSKHQFIGVESENASICRMLYYPPVQCKSNVLKNQLRCGEHSDYGTITLLFQDQEGLQVVNPHGDYIDAIPVADSIIVNGGDLLEIWSSGRFKATKHRVVVPEDDGATARQSLTLFVHPDNNVTVRCLDESDKYLSVNAYSYLLKKFEETYL